jgi:hypothetical protein
MSCCPAPSAGRGSLRAWLATAQVLALPGTGGHGGRDRGAAQVAGRTGPRRRCPHNPVPLAATPPAPKSRGPVCVFDLEDDEASRLYRAPAAQAAQVLLRAELSNECWQADTTHWSLSDGTDVEVLNIIDDRSRLLVASRASLTTKPADVVATFEAAGTEVGLGGVTYKHGQPYHPRPITEPGCDDSLSPVVSTSLAITYGPRHGTRRVHGWFGGAALELVDCTVAGCHIHGSSLVIGGK